ncbi:hypothetical protein CHS0354_040757 [Potamilus streckersoni]|uniref:F5/8 type C domain-containing protein n=1 Tax=Potamilus streckersoni TaxID=2493646 RepID=A0AAE0SM02_9BIVA|nr:hypothetical protein CHS0354_040757 [Potamilus streckersoni]
MAPIALEQPLNESSHLGCDNSLISDPQTIPDDHFTATSNYSYENKATCFPFRARFSLDYPDNETYCGAWAAADEFQNMDQYIQVNLSKMHSVRKIKTQGRTFVKQYVKSYKVRSSTDGSFFQTVQNSTAHGDLVA